MTSGKLSRALAKLVQAKDETAAISRLLFCGLLLGAGCGKEPDATPKSPATPPAATADPVDASGLPPAPVAAANPRPVVGVSESIPADHFSQLSQALLTFRRDKKRAPKDWQELLATGYLKQMPKAPPGKRYTFNPFSLDVLTAPAVFEQN